LFAGHRFGPILRLVVIGTYLTPNFG
jgi:hypothetical protein